MRLGSINADNNGDAGDSPSASVANAIIVNRRTYIVSEPPSLDYEALIVYVTTAVNVPV